MIYETELTYCYVKRYESVDRKEACVQINYGKEKKKLILITASSSYTWQHKYLIHKKKHCTRYKYVNTVSAIAKNVFLI